MSANEMWMDRVTTLLDQLFGCIKELDARTAALEAAKPDPITYPPIEPERLTAYTYSEAPVAFGDLEDGTPVHSVPDAVHVTARHMFRALAAHEEKVRRELGEPERLPTIQCFEGDPEWLTAARVEEKRLRELDSPERLEKP